MSNKAKLLSGYTFVSTDEYKKSTEEILAKIGVAVKAVHECLEPLKAENDIKVHTVLTKTESIDEPSTDMTTEPMILEAMRKVRSVTIALQYDRAVTEILSLEKLVRTDFTDMYSQFNSDTEMVSQLPILIHMMREVSKDHE